LGKAYTYLRMQWELWRWIFCMALRGRWLIWKHIFTVSCLPFILMLVLSGYVLQEPAYSWPEAIVFGKLSTVSWIIAVEGVNINQPVLFGNQDHPLSPLHLAAYANRTDIVECLIMHGADVNATDEGSWTPMHFGALVGNTDILELLLSTGAAIDSADDRMQNPLHIAAANGRTEAMVKLIAAGAAVDPPLRGAMQKNPRLAEQLKLSNPKNSKKKRRTAQTTSKLPLDS